MKKNLKWVLFGLILLISILVIGIKISTLNHSNQKEIEEDVIFKEEDSKKEIVEPEKESNKVFVDIKGAIVNPGVYEIEENKKVMDVISLAGGFLDEANTTTINLAKKVKNEMVIIVYTNEEIKKLEHSAQTVKKVDNTCLCPQIKNDACLNTEEKKQPLVKKIPKIHSKKLSILTRQPLQTLTNYQELVPVKQKLLSNIEKKMVISIKLKT